MTLLIGANDVVQGVPVERYVANVAAILDALGALLPADRIVTIAIPDYTVTPRGGTTATPSSGARRIARTTRSWPDWSRSAASRSSISSTCRDEPPLIRTLVADDGLHPSGAQYALWVERIAPMVRVLLGS